MKPKPELWASEKKTSTDQTKMTKRRRLNKRKNNKKPKMLIG